MATTAKRSRRERTLMFLETQLKSGVKTLKGTRSEKVSLTDSDKRRIEKEINNLKK